MAALETGKTEIVDPRSLELDQTYLLAQAFLAGYREPTRNLYSSTLRFWLGFCEKHAVHPIKDVMRWHIELWGRELEEVRGNAPATVSNRLTAVCMWYQWLHREEYIDKDPGAYVKRPTVANESTTIGLDRREFFLLFEESMRRPSYHALVCLLAFNGLRISEALGTNIEDLGATRGHKTLRISGKGGKITQEALAPSTWHAIDQAVGDRQSGPIIIATTGGRMARGTAAKALARLGLAAGIKTHIHPHQLRHMAVTAGLDAGVDLRDIQTFARHAKADTTVRYDRNRMRLDRHATYRIAPFLVG